MLKLKIKQAVKYQAKLCKDRFQRGRFDNLIVVITFLYAILAVLPVNASIGALFQIKNKSNMTYNVTPYSFYCVTAVQQSKNPLPPNDISQNTILYASNPLTKCGWEHSSVTFKVTSTTSPQASATYEFYHSLGGGGKWIKISDDHNIISENNENFDLEIVNVKE